ncbi:MAG: hypothetical protein EP343_34765 [Deltaproteobacteria bacterium]|nr:MAG: hypothetical protein EP343_34765 [Deltaproteobacteria bacterium]
MNPTYQQPSRLPRWLKRIVLVTLLLVLLGVIAFAAVVYSVPYPIETLHPRHSEPLVIKDRKGRVLRRVPSQGQSPRRYSWVPLHKLPRIIIRTLVASEDHRFFQHAGVDVRALFRAFWLNLRRKRFAFGGSTLTMQLVRLVHSQGRKRTFLQKLHEIVWALRLERKASKAFVLEQYLNRAYYGNRAYGIEGAAWTYFNRSARSLNKNEAIVLSALPRSPSSYNPMRHRKQVLRRRNHLLRLLKKRGWVSETDIEKIKQQPLRWKKTKAPFHAPHFVSWLLRRLPSKIRQRGGTLHTTLDLRLQQQLQQRVREHVAMYRHKALQQAGVLVLDTATGQVLAMVGSTGFFQPNGQLNITTWHRHPGSALKPFVYALALEKGHTPATIAYDIHDVPSRYRVRGKREKEHGPVRYREALACSYNFAAVHVLEKVGVGDLLSRLRKARVGKLKGSPVHYGLRLALGSAKVSLLKLASAYGFLVRQGAITGPQGWTHWIDTIGRKHSIPKQENRQLFSPEASWLVMDMLADPEARRPMFGQELPLDLPFRVAAKTGTAQGLTDMVAIGVTSEVTVAAWAGTFDGKPVHRLLAMKAATPLVRAGLQFAREGRNLTLPQRPQSLIRRNVCSLSGMKPTTACPHVLLETFRPEHAPKHQCTWHKTVRGTTHTFYPKEIRRWSERQRTQGGKHLIPPTFPPLP